MSQIGVCTGEVLVHRLAVGTVMPVMKPRRHHEPSKRAELPPDIGVNKRRLRGNEKDVHHKRGFGEPEDEDRNVNETARENHIHEVQSRSGQPIHLFGRMMNGMKRPEKPRRMKAAMDPVLSEIGDEYQHRNLKKRQRGNHGLHRRNARPAEEDESWSERENRQDLDQERIHEKVGEVHRRQLITKDLLIGAQPRRNAPAV